MQELRERTYKFSLEIIKLTQKLPNNQVSQILGRQILRSGTSIGANVEEAYVGLTKKGFTHSINISRKESNENRYWLKLLSNSNILNTEQTKELIIETNELIKIFTSIVKKSKNVIIFILTFNFLLLSCLYSQDITNMYQDAMNAFYKKDYKKAISIWEEILKYDSNQKNPPKLIEMARGKMKDKVNPLLNEFHINLGKGNYPVAYEKMKELLDIDPLNKNFSKIALRLETIIATIVSSLVENGKIYNILRKSIIGYVVGFNDERVPVLASRYAWQLDPNNKLSEKVYLFMDREFNTISRLEVPEKGKNVMEQKLAVILDDIYDGKYEHALIECELVLQIEPDNVMAWKRLGSVYYALGKRKDAKNAWEKALKLDPNDKEIAKFYNKIK